MKTRIILVDDHKIVRDGIAQCLRNHSDLEIVAEAGDGHSAIRLVKEHSPDVVVMDIGMPDLNGVEATRKVIADDPRVRVIALSMHSDSRFVGRMLRAGARGYLLKDCAVDELAEAIRKVVGGGVYLSAGITGIVVDDYVRQLSSGEKPTDSPLTDREREVLQVLAEGKTTKQIALQLHVSVKTIETHRQRIMEKLRLHSVAELTKYAIREGLTSLDG